MAIKKLQNVPIGRRRPQSFARSEKAFCMKSPSDEDAHGEQSSMGQPECGQLESPAIAQGDVWKNLPPHFSVVQGWLLEVEGSSIGNHKFVRLLGEGSYGRVYASGGENGTLNAVKVLRKSQIRCAEATQALVDECNFLAQLNHPNICAFKGIINGLKNFYVFMEFAGSTSLYEILYRSGPLDWRRTQHIFLAIVQGTYHMHGRGVAHCDLKPGNIVISQEGTPKIVDFGLALNIYETKVFGPRGTFPFIPPEAVVDQGTPYDLAKGDIWSLGVVLLEMLCGVDKVSRMLGWVPNAPMTKLRVMQLVAFLRAFKALEASVAVELGPASEHFAFVLLSMMNCHPRQRWGTEEALLTLMDSWA